MANNNNILPIIFLLLNSFVFAISSGINSVSFPLILYKNLNSTSIVGISSAVEILAGIIISGFLFSLSKKIGLLKMMVIFAISDSIIILILPSYQNFSLWILLIFIHGFSWFSVITLRQSWMNIILSDNKRAMILALNSTMLCSGFTLGPIIVKFIGAGEYLVFVFSSFFAAVSCLGLLLINKYQPELAKTPSQVPIFTIIKNNSEIFLARFILEFQCAVTVLFTVIYGMENNISAENAGILVSAFMGISLFDFIIGFIIKNNFKDCIRISFIGCLVMILILPLVIDNFYAAMTIFAIYGWFTSLAFISATTQVNFNRRADEVVSVNSAFQAVALFGALCGTLLVGIAIQLVGSNGFVLTIALANIIYFIYQKTYRTLGKNK